MANILVFGASTTYGAWDVEGSGWVQRLRKFIDEEEETSGFKNHHLVYNLGISGDKTTGLIKRFEAEAKARIKKNRETIILFHIGINDAIYNEKMDRLEIPPREYKNNLTQLINLAKKLSQKVVIIGSMPVDKRVDPMPWSPGRAYKNEHVKQFNKIMEEVARENEVHFIEIYQRFVKEDYSKLLADGVHMNNEGHRKFFEIVKEFLIAKKII